jgi:hypothetical protein
VPPGWPGYSGGFFSLNVRGRNGQTANGKWVQTYVSTLDNFTTDCGATCPSPFYTPDYSNGGYFFDAPLRFEGPVTWLAQTSYLLPGQSGAAFTIQWGFTLLNGFATPIAPVVVSQPWDWQQTQISKAQGAP